MTRDYALFGLRLRSAIPLPELREAASVAEPDIVIDVGDVAPSGAQDGVAVVDDGQALLQFSGVCRFAVCEGRRIVIDADEGADVRNVRLFLLGSAMGLLLHQRGLLPLHANAVAIGEQAVAFMGPSGIGKSTLAAWFEEQGHGILADDVCVVDFDAEGMPTAVPGLPRFRLWRDAVSRLGEDPERYERSYAGDDSYDKFDVPVSRTIESALPLAAVCVLEKGEGFDLRRLHGVAAAEALFANTYRGMFVHSVGEARRHWEACLRLIDRCPIFAVSRSMSASQMGQENLALLAELAGKFVKNSPVDSALTSATR